MREMNEDNNLFDAALKTRTTQYMASDALRARVLKDIAADSLPSTATTRPLGSNKYSWAGVLSGIGVRGVGAGFAMGALCAIIGAGLFFQAGNDDRLADEILTGHVRALMTGHLTDVVSTDRHTVKPWFAGKLDFSPPVWNERPGEYPLIGGRVDYLHHRAVAALVYKNKEHLINVFVWPQPKIEPALRRAAHAQQTWNGFQWLTWNDAGMQFWAVSDASAEELERFREVSRMTGGTNKDAL